MRLQMVAYLSRRLQDLSAMLTLDDIRRPTDGEYVASEFGDLMRPQ